MERNAKNGEALWKLSRSYRWRGDQAKSKKEKLSAYKAAERYAKKAIEANPERAGGHLMLGIAYGRIGETKGVLKSLFLISPIKKEMQAVLGEDPDNDVAHHILGVLYRKIPVWLGGSLKQSATYFKKAIRENPLRTSHYLELAKTYLKHGKQENAVQSLESLLRIKNPEDRVRSKQDRMEAASLLASLRSK